MRALVFKFSYPRFALARVMGFFSPRGFTTPGGPFGYGDIPEPTLPADDWVVVRTKLCGICGSDSKQVFLHGAFDNPITSLITFPQVLGHEAVGIVDRVGPGVKHRKVGERVVLNPWLSCTPRGIAPVCDACERGMLWACANFNHGDLPPGIHIGTCTGAPGGYAPRFAAHESQLFAIPDGVSDEQAVLADPFAVSFHAVLKVPPADNSMALVYGAGTLGLLTVKILRALYPTVRVVVIARYHHQRQRALDFGAHEVLASQDPTRIIERIGSMVHAEVHRPWFGRPWILRGVDVVYDTIGSAESLEVGVRVARPRASIVVTGVDTPARFEWTPLYFKEVAIVGSNAFGIEDFEGERRHAMDIYLRLMASGRFDASGMITHRFRVDEYREAFVVANRKGPNEAVKAIFRYDE